MRRLAPAALVIFAASAARAEAPRVKADVSPEVVGPGGAFQLQIEATSSEAGGVSDVTVPTPPGFKKLGEHKTTTSQISMSAQGTERRQGLTVVYTFSTEKIGTFKLGPIAVRTSTARYTADGPRVQVAKDAPAQRPQQRGQDPFGGLFGSFPNFPGLDEDPFFGGQPQRAAVDPKLALAAPRNEVMFFHARTDPSDLVLGQRLLFDVLLYVEEGIRAPDFSDVREAKTNDFLSKPVEVKREPRDLGVAEIAGKRWLVKLFRRYELTPLKPGKAEIGPLVGQVPTRSGKTTPRESEPLTVIVREPPAAGRPNGYQLGTVGKYELKAEPFARSLHTGDRSALVVHCTGIGTPPSKLQFRDFGTAVVLGEPEIVDAEAGGDPNAIPGVDDADPRTVATTRTFKYLLEVREPGAIDLGAVSLPTYLTTEKRYDTTSVPLGVVQVDGAAQLADPEGDPKSEHVVLDLGAPLPALAGHTSAAPSSLPVWAYGVPLAVPGVSWLGLLWRRLRAQKATRDAGKKPDLKARIDAALDRGDLTTFARLLVEHVAGREVPRDEWATALADRSPAEFLAFVTRAEEARYAPGADSSALAGEARAFRKQWGP